LIGLHVSGGGFTSPGEGIAEGRRKEKARGAQEVIQVRITTPAVVLGRVVVAI
jgi:hypothetical protein